MEHCLVPLDNLSGVRSTSALYANADKWHNLDDWGDPVATRVYHAAPSGLWTGTTDFVIDTVEDDE